MADEGERPPLRVIEGGRRDDEPPPHEGRGRALALILLAIAILFALFALFLVKVAAPNIVAAGRRTAEEMAVDRLREILWAEEQARAARAIDRDGDGVPEYAFLDELVGTAPPRSGVRLTDPPLGPSHFHRISPPAAPPVYQSEGYAFAVYLPAPDGSGSLDGGPVDARAAAGRFWAYAWPVERGAGRRVFYLDQDERICESDNPADYSGAAHPPAALAAIPPSGPLACARGGDGTEWREWRHKKPRARR